MFIESPPTLPTLPSFSITQAGMATYARVETGIAENDTAESVEPVVGIVRSNLGWKISMVLVVVVGLAVLGHSSGTGVVSFEIMADALQKKDEQTPCQDSDLANVCTGGGDPHFHQRFHNLGPINNYGIGVFPLARSLDGDFELQGFQCLSGSSSSYSSLAAFAVKIGGKTATYFGADDADFKWHPAGGPPDGVTLNGKPGDTEGLTIKSPDMCQSLWIVKKTTHSGKLGFMLDMDVRVSSAAKSGICGDATIQKEVLASRRLFNHNEMLHICSMCKVEKNCTGLHSGLTEMDIKEVCRQNNVTHATATEKCKKAKVSEGFNKSCIFDYCASGGDYAAVENAVIESEHMRHPPARLRHLISSKSTASA